MRGLRHLALGDIATIALAIAVGNAFTLGVFAVLGVSTVPPDTGILGLIAGFLLVVLGLTAVPTILLFLLAYISFQLAQ